jgi:hypothetical protein
MPRDLLGLGPRIVARGVAPTIPSLTDYLLVVFYWLLLGGLYFLRRREPLLLRPIVRAGFRLVIPTLCSSRRKDFLCGLAHSVHFFPTRIWIWSRSAPAGRFPTSPFASRPAAISAEAKALTGGPKSLARLTSAWTKSLYGCEPFVGVSGTRKRDIAPACPRNFNPAFGRSQFARPSLSVLGR